MSREDYDAGVAHFECPDCGAEVSVLYTRDEFDTTMATGWCPESGVSKAVPVSKVTHVE